MSTPAATGAGAPTGEFDLATQRLARPAVQMAVGTTLSRATGLARTAAMAIALGVSESRLADSYNIANTLPNIIYELVLGGVLSSVFIPVLVEELRTRVRAEAWRSVSALVTSALAVLVAMTVATVLLAPLIIDVFSGRVPGAEGREQHALATFFLQLFAPQIALYGFAAIADGLLNAHGKFALPAFAPIVNNVVVITTFLVFAALTTGVRRTRAWTPTSASSCCSGSGPRAGWSASHLCTSRPWRGCPSASTRGSTSAARRCASSGACRRGPWATWSRT